MAGALIPLQIASAGLTVLGQVQSGRAANAAAKADARRLEQAAKRERAIGQRRAEDARRANRRAQSDFLARAAASGSAADPTARALLARLEGDGEMSALEALAEGEARGRNQDYSASRRRFDGKVSLQKSNLGALSSGLSFAAKYGPPAYEKLQSLAAADAAKAEIWT